MFSNFKLVLHSMLQLKLPLLLPLIKPVVILSVVVTIVFLLGIDRMLAENNILGMLVIGGLLVGFLATVISAVQKIPLVLWVQDHQSRSIGYLRTLPVSKFQLWAANVFIHIVIHILELIALAVLVLFSVPFLANVLNGAWEFTGLGWWGDLYQEEIFQFFGNVTITAVFLMLLLGILFGGRYVPTARRGAKGFNKIYVNGKNYKTDNIINISGIMLLIVAVSIYIVDLPFILLAIYLAFHAAAIYGISYLVFSGVNCPVASLRRVSGYSLLAGVAITSIASMILYQGVGSADFGFRTGSYLLLKPVGSERYADQLISELSGIDESQSDGHLNLGFIIVPLDMLLKKKQVFNKMLPEANCLQKKILLQLISVGSLRDNYLKPHFIDKTGNAINGQVDRPGCQFSSGQLAELIFHSLNESDQMQYIKLALASISHFQRVVAARLASKIPLDDPGDLRVIRDRVFDNLKGLCHKNLSKNEWQLEFKVYNNAIVQLFLVNRPAQISFSDENGNCNKTVEASLNLWKEKVEGILNVSHTRLLNDHIQKKYQSSLVIQNSSNISDIEFEKLILQPHLLRTLSAPVKCHLAQQWRIRQGVADLPYTYFSVDWPREYFSFENGLTFSPLFSSSDCA